MALNLFPISMFLIILIENTKISIAFHRFKRAKDNIFGVQAHGIATESGSNVY